MKRFFSAVDPSAMAEKLSGAVDARTVVKGNDQVVEQDWWWKPFWSISAFLLFLGMVLGIGHQLWQWMDRPVENVLISGASQHLDKQELGAQIASQIDSSLLGLELAEVQQAVKAQPWVRLSAVERDWPNTLHVMIEEEVPVARWGEKGLLNHQGDIFWPELKPQDMALPRLSGPAPDTARVISQFHDLNQMFRMAGLSVVSLELEPRGAWTLELSNEIQLVVGREDINDRLGRFLKLYKQRLEARAEEIERIDVRYPHGVAVKWRKKPDEEIQDTPT